MVTIQQVESTVGIGTRFGGTEVVAEALAEWLFSGEKGQICISATKDGKTHKGVVTLQKIRGLKKDKEGIAQGRVSVKVTKKSFDTSNIDE